MVAPKAEASTHPAQISHIAALQWDKISTKISVEYADFSDLFSSNFVIELSDNTGTNKHAIELAKKKQLFNGSMYALNSVELETLKIYIKIYLKTGYICLSKFLTGISIPFNRKPDSSFYLCVNYWDLNNLTIKNQYSLSLIGEWLDQLNQAERLT